LLSIADDYTARFANDDGRNLPIGFSPNIPEYTLIFPYSGELQNFGSDVVVNGGFDSNIDGWSVDAGTSITWDSFNSGVCKADGSSLYRYIKRTPNLIAGKTYIIVWDAYFVDDVPTNYMVDLGGSYNKETVPSGYTVGQWYTFTMIYTINNDTNIYLGFDTGISGGDIIYMDNIIVKELTTKTQQDQIRVITHSESTSTDTYRINHVEQDTAILPDADTAMTQSDIALIGYGDTITECMGNAEAYSYAMTTAQQLTRQNEIIDANFDVLTHPTTGEPLLDENGLYMYNR